MTVPKMSANTVLLQVAAVTHQGDALAMADALQQQKVPVVRGGAFRRQRIIACKLVRTPMSAPPKMPEPRLTAPVSRLSSSIERSFLVSAVAARHSQRRGPGAFVP